jgi:hypothetical protein
MTQPSPSGHRWVLFAVKFALGEHEQSRRLYGWWFSGEYTLAPGAPWSVFQAIQAPISQKMGRGSTTGRGPGSPDRGAIGCLSTSMK